MLKIPNQQNLKLTYLDVPQWQKLHSNKNVIALFSALKIIVDNSQNRQRLFGQNKLNYFFVISPPPFGVKNLGARLVGI